MKDIELIQKLSVLHCVFQLIASADGRIDEERDAAAIKLTLAALGLESVHYWDMALQQNPHDSFIHVSTLDENDKSSFRKVMLEVAVMGGNAEFRESCAMHLFQLCNV
jgi:hypothetical protein